MTPNKSKPNSVPKDPNTSTSRQPSSPRADTSQTTPKGKAASTSEVGEARQLDRVQGRVAELEAALQAEQQHVQDLQSKMAYLQAEFQNSVKALERRQTQFIEQANRELVLRLLPVLDDLERARIMVPAIRENQPFTEGLSMVLEGFRAALESAGVKRIECEGQAFDPLRHEAVVREETTQYAPNTVIEELQKGYLLKGSLLRPSLVRIAVQPATAAEKGVTPAAQNSPQKELEKDQPKTKSQKRSPSK